VTPTLTSPRLGLSGPGAILGVWLTRLTPSPTGRPSGAWTSRASGPSRRSTFSRGPQSAAAARLAGPARQTAHALRQAADAGMGWQGTPSDARCAPAAIRAGPPAMTIVERRNWEQAIDRFDAAARGRDITAVIAGFEQLAALLDQAGAQDTPAQRAGQAR